MFPAPERLCRSQGGIVVPVVGMGASLIILGVTAGSRTGGDRDVPSGEGKEQQSNSRGVGSGSGQGKPLSTTNPRVDSPSIHLLLQGCSRDMVWVHPSPVWFFWDLWGHPVSAVEGLGSGLCSPCKPRTLRKGVKDEKLGMSF